MYELIIYVNNLLYFCSNKAVHPKAQIGSCWGKVFRKQASMGGAASFRKAAVSAMNESNEDMRGDLADLLVHHKTTADNFFLLQNKGKSAVKTSKELSHIMCDASEKTATR